MGSQQSGLNEQVLVSCRVRRYSFRKNGNQISQTALQHINNIVIQLLDQSSDAVKKRGYKRIQVTDVDTALLAIRPKGSLQLELPLQG